MADNFLERKMEDLQRGNHTYYTPKRPNPKKGFIQFPFSPKRVLIASDFDGNLEMARTFLKYDCKVAITLPPIEDSETLAKKEGFRFYPSPFDVSKFQNLLKAWRDIDIIITDLTYAPLIISIWKEHRNRFPYVSSYLSRLIILGQADSNGLMQDLYPYNISVNTLIPADIHAGRKLSKEEISQLILLLSLPQNDFISGMEFPI